MTFYNLRNNPPGELPFTIIKFSSDLNPESTYSVGFTACSCPAGHRPKCRHREMLPKLRERVDTAWFWHFETQSWADPTGEAKAHDEVAEHDKATGGLEADQVSDTNPIEAQTIMPDIITDKGFIDFKTAKPSGNEAALGFRRRI